MTNYSSILVTVYYDSNQWKFKTAQVTIVDSSGTPTLQISDAAAVVTFSLETPNCSFESPLVDWSGIKPAWISAPMLSGDHRSFSVAVVNGSDQASTTLLDLKILNGGQHQSALINIAQSTQLNSSFTGADEIRLNQIHIYLSLSEHSCTFSGDVTGDTIYVQDLAAELLFEITQAPPGWHFSNTGPFGPLAWGSGMDPQPANCSQVLNPKMFSFGLVVINNSSDPFGTPYRFELFFTQGAVTPTVLTSDPWQLIKIDKIRTWPSRALHRGIDPTIINQQPDPTGGNGTAPTEPQCFPKVTIAA